MEETVNIDKLLEEARASISSCDYDNALRLCQEVSNLNKSSYEAFVYVLLYLRFVFLNFQTHLQHPTVPLIPCSIAGKAAFHLAETAQAETAYKKAIELNPEFLPAWHGLAEVYSSTDNVEELVGTNEMLLKLTAVDSPNRVDVVRFLAEAYKRAGYLKHASDVLVQFFESSRQLSPDARLDTLCDLADIQLQLDEIALDSALKTELHEDSSECKLPPVAEEGSEISTVTTDPVARLTQRARQQALQRSADAPPARTVSMLELDLLSAQALADDEEEEHSTADTLVEIILHAPLADGYTKYMDEFLKRCLLKLFSHCARSMEREQFRLAALREAHALVARGGCTTPLPYEAAIWLLEEEEEIKGGQIVGGCGSETMFSTQGAQATGGARVSGGHELSHRVCCAFDNFAIRLIHQFPTNPTARVCQGLIMRRRAHASLDGGGGHHPIPQVLRRQLEALLSSAIADGAEKQNDCASGWKALAELQYENRKYQEAYSTALKGLSWLQDRRARGHEALTQLALGLRLVVAKSLRRMKRLDEAEIHFKALAGWTTEGELGFAEMSGAAPVAVHQQALRGIALCELEKGNRDAAKAQYERILGKAALGRGPGEHWAWGDYGWLLFEEGDFQGAKEHLQKAVAAAESGVTYVTDSQLGEHQYRLGEVYWAMRGRYRTEKQFAYMCFLEAARAEGHAQAPALAGLGRYLEQVEKKPEAAARVYRKALAIDPEVDLAGAGRTMAPKKMDEE